MERINEIEKAVANLPPNDLARFREWFEEFDALQWDRQFEEDALSGKLNSIAKEALANFNKGTCEKL